MTKTLGKFELPTHLAKVENSATDTYAVFVAEPFESGFAHTIGNTLRRILLGAIEGASITNVYVEGVEHEFRTINGVVEDVSEILLNLKKVLFRTDSRESKALTIGAFGSGVVRAGDIVLPEDVSILNPEHVLFHMDGVDRVSFKMILRRGRGYSTAEENEKIDAVPGGIAVDSPFSPVTAVNYFVDSARVGQDTDHDRLTLKISTDGTVTPGEVLAQAVAIAMHHFEVFVDKLYDEEIEFQQSERRGDGDQNRLQKLLGMSVNEIELSVRAANCLNNANILTVGELASKTESEMLRYRNFGKKSLTEIKNRLEELGLSLGMRLDGYS
ncbi:MAG: DNA-directed RNA polymerase subunit alpha [Puniceicoccales bacterium]|nr:DNA-directed RNA polymerase subunit alpha [Puniceicoccales bacterium]